MQISFSLSFSLFLLKIISEYESFSFLVIVSVFQGIYICGDSHFIGNQKVGRPTGEGGCKLSDNPRQTGEGGLKIPILARRPI